jgi:hypothetical protein
MRFVGETLVMRLSRPLDARAINGLQTGFVDLLKPGGRIVASAALPEEADEPGLLELPRLLVDFNRKDFGRLRLLIDAINH